MGQARLAFVILLFVIVGKFKSAGLLEIPSIAGFFTYQLASLNIGLREMDDQLLASPTVPMTQLRTSLCESNLDNYR